MINTNLNRTFIILSVVFTCLGIPSSCNENKLDVEPVNEFLSSNYYISEDQVFESLVGAYDPVSWSMSSGKWISYVMFGEIRSDNANAGGDKTNSDQPAWQAFDDFLGNNTSDNIQPIYRRNYIGIFRANAVIENPKINTPKVKLYQAEAKFLRAYFHFEAFKFFGPIPVITKTLTPDDKDLKRNTMSEVFEAITKDLEDATDLLPINVNASEAGRATRGAALALLGKAYLYWADLANDDKPKFQKAAENLQKVVDLGVYQLADDYKSLFGYNVKNTTGSIFEAQHTNLFPSDWSWAEGIDGNAIVQLCGIRGLGDCHPTYKEGWGFMLGTASLYNHFLSDDTIRRDATLISETELVTACGASALPKIKDESNPTDYTGYWTKKYANYKAYDGNNVNGGTPELTKDGNTYIIRYADVLLMLAEALHRGSGNDAKAKEYIDQVRKRASGNNSNFRNTDKLISEEGWSLMDVIWYERRAELGMEGDRWFDLVRSGRAQSTLFPSGDLRATNFKEDEHLWLPIALEETNVTKNLTTYPDQSLFK